MAPPRPPTDTHRDATATERLADAQAAYRDLWMSECWKLVPEWHQTKDERLAAAARNQVLHQS